jgi:hypothetical protein
VETVIFVVVIVIVAAAVADVFVVELPMGL